MKRIMEFEVEKNTLQNNYVKLGINIFFSVKLEEMPGITKEKK
jgi:hypothetical protein